jgi:hypothetical protein
MSPTQLAAVLGLAAAAPGQRAVHAAVLHPSDERVERERPGGEGGAVLSKSLRCGPS